MEGGECDFEGHDVKVGGKSILKGVALEVLQLNGKILPIVCREVGNSITTDDGDDSRVSHRGC